MEINKYNFWDRSSGTWDVCDSPNCNPTIDSPNGSKYWIYDKYVIRCSDHWGHGIADCDWVLGDNSIHNELDKKINGSFRCGIIKYEDLKYNDTLTHRDHYIFSFKSYKDFFKNLFNYHPDIDISNLEFDDYDIISYNIKLMIEYKKEGIKMWLKGYDNYYTIIPKTFNIHSYCNKERREIEKYFFRNLIINQKL